MEALQRLQNRGSISTGYEIDNSLKIEADNTEYLSRTPSSNTNRQTFTYSTWVKRTEMGQTSALLEAYQDGTNFFILQFAGSKGRITVYNIDSGTDYGYTYTPAHRDTSAWYHIVFVSDTTNSTASDRYQLYVNGVRVTDITTDYGTPPQNYNNNLNSTIAHNIGRRQDGNTYMSAYLAETHLVDGTALAPTAFGEFDEDSGIWKPKQVTGVTYGTNGFYLDYSTASDLGADKVAGGNSNDFTENNIAAADQATDTPTNNFCTLNVIANIENNAVVFTEGATVGSVSGGGNVSDHAMATMGFSSGKWYYEAYVTTGSTSDDAMFGFANTNGWYQGLGNDTYSAGAHQVGRWYYNSNTFTTTGATGWDKGDIVQIAIDCDNGKCWSGVNGTYSSGNPSTNTGGFDWDANVTNMSIGDLVIPVTRVLYTAPGTTYYNFGGYTLVPISSAASDANGYGTFEYAPPTGFHALCTKNLEEFG